MTDLNTKKNQIRLQLRKARQRAIKNLRRDMSKYPEDQEKFNKILVRVKKAKIERVLTLLLENKIESTNLEDLPGNAGQNKILKLYLSSKEKSLFDEVKNGMADFVTETRKEQPKNKRKKPDKKAKKEAKKSKISDTIEADLENSANDPVSDIQPVPEADFSDAESSASSKDSFFLDSEPENDEKSTVDSNRQPEKSQKSQSQNGSNFQQDLQLDYIKNSKFSHDKKRNYQEKRDLYYKQKFLDKQNNKSQAHLRNHTHLLKCEEKLHPSWQAKIANKRKMEELKNVKNSKVKFDSDSD